MRKVKPRSTQQNPVEYFKLSEVFRQQWFTVYFFAISLCLKNLQKDIIVRYNNKYENVKELLKKI